MADAIECKPAYRSICGEKPVLPVFGDGHKQRTAFFMLVLATVLVFGGCALTHPTEPYSYGGIPGNPVLQGRIDQGRARGGAAYAGGGH